MALNEEKQPKLITQVRIYLTSKFPQIKSHSGGKREIYSYLTLAHSLTTFFQLLFTKQKIYWKYAITYLFIL
jgi:hypothetical protein